MAPRSRPVGELLRKWRQQRGISQMELALRAEVSTRHISFMETGRSIPSREMILHLAEELEIPLRDRNGLLVAAGYAPSYVERRLDDPALRAAREAVDMVLSGHEPYPALAVDRHWTLVSANGAIAPLLVGVDPELLQPPVNVLRLSLHPRGLAPRIANLAQWRGHLLARLHRQVEMSTDSSLASLLEELKALPAPSGGPSAHESPDVGVVVPLRLDTEAGQLSLFSTITVFGTANDITLSELAIESFFPADAATAETLRRLGASNARPGSSEEARP
ncbi:transcriptional regulator [Corallococcus sp. H22C18031201]|uniref:helix-turn-helix domain-containing protein n=1 Tax=Citreicoccus inhibens TaxID=2849499 RepID=UPI000E73C3F5|nr:helix-turn-helix transcriptional regulator [Citreicoccus inhibens]MBU8896383.1 helix-turn-helix transcriptional regulator [Citreicoccus inhibens]RJS24231.1 transcriptional regulator [Corallococcus sp. H22C18031201]